MLNSNFKVDPRVLFLEEERQRGLPYSCSRCSETGARVSEVKSVGSSGAVEALLSATALQRWNSFTYNALPYSTLQLSSSPLPTSGPSTRCIAWPARLTAASLLPISSCHPAPRVRSTWLRALSSRKRLPRGGRDLGRHNIHQRQAGLRERGGNFTPRWSEL